MKEVKPMKQRLGKGSSRPLAVSKTQSGQEDELVRLMREKEIPLTRKNYLDLAWPDRTAEDEMDAEFESQLPEMFRKKY